MIKNTIYKIINNNRNLIPGGIRTLMRGKVATPGYDLYLQEIKDPYINDTPIYNAPESIYTLGIIKEFHHYHKNYIHACRELGLSYKLIDISGSDWIDVVEKSGCDAFLVHPPASLTIWKEMFDERIKVLESDLEKIVYPTYKEIWLYECKRRVRDWLLVKKIPHPKTWIFYNLDEALEFINNSNLPIVFKTNTGASASGVFILRSRAQAQRLIRLAFSKGIIPRRRNPNDRQWGSVILQEYLPEVKEWRMVRIGNSFFGHPKGRLGDFHSGSGVVDWDVPSIDLLNLLRDVTDKGGFTSMNVDVFETADGRLLVNELQTVFGAGYSVDQLRVDGKPGRFVTNNQEWIFEPGDFARNACANARVEYLLSILDADIQ
jgi:hypothetical protein